MINDQSQKMRWREKNIDQYKNKLNMFVVKNEKNIGLGSIRNDGLKFIKHMA